VNRNILLWQKAEFFAIYFAQNSAGKIYQGLLPSCSVQESWARCSSVQVYMFTNLHAAVHLGWSLLGEFM